MKDTEWGPSPRRRKPNSIDIFGWIRFLKRQVQKAWFIPRAPYYLSVSLLALLIGIFAFVDITVTSGKIHPGVSLAGFDVGGLTKQQAASALKKSVEANINKSIKVEYKDKNGQVVPSQLDLTLSYEKSAETAFNYGRGQTFTKNAWKRIISWFRVPDLNPAYQLNSNRLDEFLHKIGGDKHTPAVNANIEIVMGKPKLVKSREGFGINYHKAARQIVAATLNPSKVVLEAQKLFPEVTEKEAAKAFADARLIIGSPVILKSGDKKYIFSKEKLITLFKAQVIGHKLKASLDKSKAIDYIKHLTGELNRKPVDAKFAVSGVKASVIPSTDGAKVNDGATYFRLTEAALRRQNRVAFVSLEKIRPKRTTTDAEKMGIKEMVSSFTTYYPAGQPRVKNIHRAADILDGMLIPPGQTFSFNGRLGERTIEKGFVFAPGISQGEFVDSVGGGICQVSTTVFNAILLGGYPVGERSPHSFFIKKYPPGRDAAVSYPKPDLTFTNDTKSWIMIKGAYTATSITISFYSTDYGREVSFITDFLGTIPFPTKEVKDATLEKGKKEEEKAGITGRRYHVIRIVAQNGKEIRRTNIHSTFKPKPRIVRVGTKPKPKENKKKEE